MQQQIMAKEVWKNMATGLRWYVHFDPVGQQKSSTVQPGKTFTISPLERRLNQQSVYDEVADPFKNGTFLNVAISDESDIGEFESVNSVTDTEIEEAVKDAVGGAPEIMRTLIEGVSSLVTMNRVYEALMMNESSPSSLVTLAKKKIDSLEVVMVDADGKQIVQNRESVSGTVDKENTKWTSKVE